MLHHYNPPTPLLVPRLVLNLRASPSAGYPLRTAMVRHNVETTYVVPGDWPSRDGTGWFPDGAAPSAMSGVQYLIDGPVAFEAMVEAMQTARQSGHFVFLLGWSLQHNFPMANGVTFIRLVEDCARQGVSVRVLMWKNSFMYGVNDASIAALNALRTAKGLDVYGQYDDNIDFPWGSHHHKIMVVQGGEGLVGFCGGMDVIGDRLKALHDVHVRVVGGAATELLRIVEQRWNNAKLGTNSVAPSPLSIPASPSASTPIAAPYLARVVQTVGNPDLRPTVPNTLWASVQFGVQTAKRFIYIEDQYLWSFDLVKELVDASKRVKHITILVPDAVIGEEWQMRQDALALLVRLGGSGIEKRIGIFRSTKPSHQWVHAKLFVFDDEYAMVGSANANNRGYFMDSEADVGIAERAWDKPEGSRAGAWFSIEANFARRMRIELWKEHLGLETEELFDGTGARSHWDSLPTTATVSPYEAVNLKKYLPLLDEYEKLMEKRGKDKDRDAGAPPAPPPPPERMVWWKAPYDEWNMGPLLRDFAVDPK